LETESHFIPSCSEPWSFYFKLPYMARITDENHHTQLFFPLRWGCHKCFCLDWPGTAILSILASQVPRMTGISHQFLALIESLFLQRIESTTQTQKLQCEFSSRW
jgi:hypothetical protein